MSNEWFDNGEFQPAGTRCMVDHLGVWGETYIVGMSEHGSCVYSLIGWNNTSAVYDGVADPSCFKPLKSEREEAIERMLDVLCHPKTPYAGQMCGALYDAGLRFKEDNQDV